MGPDCGTAIVNGVPLRICERACAAGRSDAWPPRAPGLQQVTCLIDRLGSGISHAIGTGGPRPAQGRRRITMLAGIRALGADQSTQVSC
jgi:FdrA protein